MPSSLRYALLFFAQFAALGILMPFLPAVLAGHGLSPQQVAVLLAAGSAVRLLANPAIGRGADILGDPRAVVILAALLGACTATGYALVGGFPGLLLVTVLHALVWAPVIPLSDALALGAARRREFDYGRVRSAGSVAFILASVAAGQAVALAGLTSIVWLFSLCLLGTAAAAWSIPAAPPAAGRERSGWAAPFADPGFRWLLPASALIQGSHALYYGFGTIHWQAAGL